MIFHTVLLQPFNSRLPVLFGPGREETYVVPLFEPLVYFPYRTRIGQRLPHPFKILVFNMLTDAPVDVDNEDFPHAGSLKIAYQAAAFSTFRQPMVSGPVCLVRFEGC